MSPGQRSRRFTACIRLDEGICVSVRRPGSEFIVTPKEVGLDRKTTVAEMKRWVQDFCEDREGGRGAAGGVRSLRVPGAEDGGVCPQVPGGQGTGEQPEVYGDVTERSLWPVASGLWDRRIHLSSWPARREPPAILLAREFGVLHRSFDTSGLIFGVCRGPSSSTDRHPLVVAEDHLGTWCGSLFGRVPSAP